jgi:hypothetical protein
VTQGHDIIQPFPSFFFKHTISLLAPPPSCPAGFLASVGATLPPRSSPLQTLPAVDVARGSEGALPGGTLTVRFAAGVMGLAGLLAAGPRLVVEVWHKERWVAGGRGVLGVECLGVGVGAPA